MNVDHLWLVLRVELSGFFIQTRTNIFDTLIYVSMNFAWNSRLNDKHFFQKTLSIVRNWIKNYNTAHPIFRSSKDFGKFVWVLKIITSFTHSPTTAPRCKSKTITRFPVQIFSVCQEEVFPGGRDTPRFNEVSQDQQCYEVQLPLRLSLSDKPRFTLDSKGWVSEEIVAWDATHLRFKFLQGIHIYWFQMF